MTNSLSISDSLQSDYLRDNLDITQLASTSDWKEILIDSVYKNKLDPWNIDISKVVSDYIRAINIMKLLDLSIPANVIVATSFLLKLKSESIQIFKEAEIYEPEEEQMNDRVKPDVPDLIFRNRHVPDRRITLDELMSALDDALKIEKKREQMFTEKIDTQINFVINRYDIDQKSNEVYEILMKNSDRYNSIMFSSLIKNFEKNILIDLFIPLLYLETNEKIILKQDYFFDDIVIKII